MPRRASGTVYLVGAGPGDPGLITVRGQELLASCDAVVFDALANPALLPVPDPSGRPELHDVGKRGGDAGSARQDEITALLIRLAAEGKQVVRLKGGDPFVFGRGGEEAEALRAEGVAFEIVPGVTAGIAAPAYAGIPVTHRGVATSVTFVTGHEDPDRPAGRTDWSALARVGGTIVLYMGMKSLPRVTGALIEAGMSRDVPAAVIEWGTHTRQRTVVATLGSIASRAAAENIGAPAVTVIGAVAELRERIAWVEARPLFGARVVVTRATTRSGRMATLLRAAGATVIEAPATRIEPLDQAPLVEVMRRVRDYDWIAFTSQMAVDLVWSALRATEQDARALAGVKLCAVGPATAESLAAHGLHPEVVPERFVAEALVEALGKRYDIRGARVLYVAAEGARDALVDGLESLGAEVTPLRVYRSVPNPEGAAAAREALERGEVDYVTYASAGAVRAFVQAVGDTARRAPAACIGPITAAAARDSGLDVAVQCEDSTVPDLVAAVEEAWRTRQAREKA